MGTWGLWLLVVSWCGCSHGQLFEQLSTPRVGYPSDYCSIPFKQHWFDFIVVGGGSAGAVVARRLAEIENWKILLVEAGGNPPALWQIPALSSFPDPGVFAIHEWGYGSQPSPNNCISFKKGQCNYRRARVLGGCTENNYMMYVRGNKYDYDEWESFGNKGWSYEDVLPYFRKSEYFIPYPITEEPTNTTVGAKYHARLGPMQVNTYNDDPATLIIRNGLFEAAQNQGIPRNLDTNGPSQIGFTDVESNIDFKGFRFGTAKGFLTNTPPNLYVCKHSVVNKVVMVGKTAIGVEITRRDKSFKMFARKEVILSAGSFGSPGILERSGIGNEELLRKLRIPVVHHLPGVGENLQDHFLLAGNAYEVKLRSDGPFNLLTAALTNFGGFVDTANSSSVPDIQFIFFAFPQIPKLGVNLLGKSLNWEDFLTDELEEVNRRSEIMILAPLVLRPESRGSVHIHDKSPNAVPYIHPKYFSHQRDIDILLRGIRLGERIVADRAFEFFEPKYVPISVCKTHKVRSDEYYTCLMKHTASTLYHPCGTTHMGPISKEWSVVDERLRVHGIKKLRIIDAGVMPLITRGNTNAPTIMIGEKGADMIKEDHNAKITTWDYV